MTTPGPLLILLAALLTNNILLTGFIGMCSFLVCSKQYDTAVGLGVAVVFVTTCTCALNYLVYYYLLLPFHAEHMSFIVFIAVIAAFTQFVEMFIERFSPKLYYALGIFLPLIAVNCVIMAVSLFMVLRQYTFLQTVGFGFGSSLGWMLAIVLMAGLRKKMEYSRVPESMQGVAIAMLITGVMAMAFMGFAGMVNIQ
jgi:Na+-transporting NADH:ubiquinone oxidoreductase subunit E